MALRFHNTLTRRKDDFTPIDPERVRVYVCGPTVYDRAHIGNARPVIVFDVLFRLLRHVYGPDHVAYARNITDIDDKIILRAAERGVSIRELTEGTARGFTEDVDALGCLRPTVEPRATDHIPEMIAVTERLIAGGHAYAPTDGGGEGHVLFAVGSMPDYGRLSNRTLDEMLAGARVEVAPYKRADGDFVLWKPSTPAEPGWDSPWGRGRPGWHLECSAMSWKHLGETFDIHGGGLDLIFPHHENELAQSCCAFHRPVMAQVWMHNGFLQVEGQKMSKSLGNFVTIRELLDTDGFGGRSWPGEVLRLAMLRTHYRQPIDWTAKALDEAERTLDRWYAAAEGVDAGEPARDFLDELSDDLNTPGAIAALHGLMGHAESRAAGVASARLLGLLGDAPSDWAARRGASTGVDPAVVEALIADRLAARREKRWADSDRIRDELAALGVVLKDNKDGTTSWDVGRKGTA
ncbi:cysteine--tRNA ligase [Lichenibacterium minor]|uniref:Cysteine--tRNA ligase n=1 Tax=Lichenibacterium minor TaxID=2316528 RepID=A0A4Q2U9H4_9HYPH|nr:cysteine--tRNA ligase [Lichenibacterium minor]RYC31811.1 cysteine--tRNA ligase [Lichenibacterium minor]